MNLKKLLISLITIVMFSVFVLTQGTVYAAKKSENMWMGVVALMNKSNPNIGYALGGNPKENNNDDTAYIWNILHYPSENAETFIDADKNFYCIKAGVGFTERDGKDNLKKRQYNVSYDMKEDRDIIMNLNGNYALKSLASRDLATTNIVEDGTNIDRYNAVLAVLDMLYLPGKSTELEKKQLIEKIIRLPADKPLIYANFGDSTDMVKAFKNKNEEENVEFGLYPGDYNDLSKFELTEYALTDNDIQAVQQAVIWYFTNYYERDKNSETYQETMTPDKIYDKTDPKDSLLYYTTDGNSYSSVFDIEGGIGDIKNQQMKVLYNYMINEAKEKVKDNITSATGSPIRIDTEENLNLSEVSGDNYIIGPIHMTELNTNSYTLDFVVNNNGTEISNYQLLNTDKTPVANGTTVKDLVGKDFYISVPKNQANNLSIDITVNYNEKTVKILTVEDPNNPNKEEQPLVEVDKTDKSEAKRLVFKEEKEFDLKLVKYISAVNGDASKGKTIAKIDTTQLASGEKTTADYDLDKNAIKVKVGDYVTYTFRVYNEGDIDGYVTKLTDNIPLGLQFVGPCLDKDDGKTITVYNYDKEKGLTSDELEVDEETYKLVHENNAQWEFDKDGVTNKIDTYDGDETPSISLKMEDYLGGTNKLLNAYDKEKDTNHDGTGLSYVDATVVYRVSETAPQDKEMRNEAAITGDSDKDGNDIEDRDSEPENWPGKDDHNNYQDDEDYDKVIIESQAFDLALRKFIIAVSDDTNIDKNEELRNADGLYTRAPVVDTSKLNTTGEDGKLITTAIYNHTKEPILVKPNDIVVYMLRVYNEGDMDGYVAEIKDHLPPYLEFVDGDYNKQYGWTISEDGRTATTKYLENSKIDAAIPVDGNSTLEGPKPGFQPYTLSYKEVPIMCKVKEEAKSNEKITNIADITEYLDENKKPATDRDSQPDNVTLPEDKDLPGYKDNETGSYIPGQQDDDDFEKVIVKIFDLALRKWVTQAIVIENGEQTITQTGHDAWDDPEAVVKVELHRKKLNQVEVKFRYSIRVYNQGEIAGYAKEVTDYIPEGLKFVAEDNPGWTDEGNNVISTRLLENTLLQPGEYADVEVLLTWIKNENNMGVMINTAEISEDYNEYGVPDIDSTPDNQKPGEDDIDDAPVMLSISTGQARIYFTLGFVVLITIAGGIVLIKKFVI